MRRTTAQRHIGGVAGRLPSAESFAARIEAGVHAGLSRTRAIERAAKASPRGYGSWIAKLLAGVPSSAAGFDRGVEQLRTQGLSRADAIRGVVDALPGAHASWLDARNGKAVSPPEQSASVRETNAGERPSAAAVGLTDERRARIVAAWEAGWYRNPDLLAQHDNCDAYLASMKQKYWGEHA